jgi:CheY-like chemotaxis protein
LKTKKYRANALQSMLNACGYRADAVGSAEEALGRMNNGGHPKVALIDVTCRG